MTKCNSELMKEIKILEAKKDDILSTEEEECMITYVEGEKKMKSDYNYEETRAKVEEIDTRIRRYKALLAYSNATTIVPEFNMTIGECLVYLAQLNGKRMLLQRYSSFKQVSRISSDYSDKVEFKETLFNVKKVREELDELLNLIAQLQMAIDRTNLTNQIEL
mgnify:CR=1 FL=1|jgi:hypothetical protein